MYNPRHRRAIKEANMQLIKEATHKEKRSKFIASFYKISSEEEARSITAGLKKEHKKANHVCWAAVIDKKEIFKNDGEVGKPANAMLDILKFRKKDQHLIAVVRYFGGIKLGPGGVKRAFKDAMMLCMPGK